MLCARAIHVCSWQRVDVELRDVRAMHHARACTHGACAQPSTLRLLVAADWLHSGPWHAQAPRVHLVAESDCL